MCRVSPQIPQTIADKKWRYLSQGQGINSTGCNFPYTYQITQYESNEVKLVSKISKFLPITTKVYFLAEANYILDICKNSRFHDGLLFLIHPKTYKVSECFDDRLLDVSDFRHDFSLVT